MKIINIFLQEEQNDISVGDVILTGRFRNVPKIVKGFGKDKKNQPTIKTNKGEISLYRFRIKKLMKENSLIIYEQKSPRIVPWNGFIYHYLFNENQVNKILKDGKLLPIDKIADKDKIKDYAERAIKKKFPGASKKNTDLKNAQIYWKHVYEEKYESIIKKPYENYGIYLTPLDLFQFDSGMKYRFRFSFYDLLKQSPDMIIGIGSKVWKVRTNASIEKAMVYFQDYVKVENLWKSSKLKFQRLPQIVLFAKSLPLDKNKLEIKNK